MQVAFLIVPVAILVWLGFLSADLSSVSTLSRIWLGILAGAALLGYWLLGALVAGVVTAAESIRHSLRAEATELPLAE